MSDPTPMAKASTSAANRLDDISQNEDIPCSSNIDYRYSSYAIKMPQIINLPNLTCQERYDIYCNEVKISDCQPNSVVNLIQVYLEEKLSDKRWLALWKGPYESSVMRTIDILVEVNDVVGDQARVSLVEPLVCSEASLPFDVIEAQLNELGYHLDVTELYPVSVLDNADDEDDDDDDEDDDGESSTNPKNSSLEDRLKQETQQSLIARVVDNVRFFFEHIRRDWDDEDDSEAVFDTYLRARLRLYYDIVNGVLPLRLVIRYNRTMAKYICRRKELLDFQAQIQQNSEPSNSEAVECWKRYYEVLMLSGLLQIWEALQLRADGPCFPRVLRRTKGQRKDNSTITHIVCTKLTAKMVRSFPDDINIKQHSAPLSAIHDCYDGDTILIFPGVYSGEGFHELTESVTIKGEGNRNEVVIEAVACDDLFVNVCSPNVKLENLTFCQVENTEGILRVESGCAEIENCVFKCDGTGLIVCEGGEIKMRNSLITGCRGSGVEFYQGSTGLLENNEIKCLNDEDSAIGELASRDCKGAVHLHVTNPPNVKIIGNKISAAANASASITVGKDHNSHMTLLSHSNAKLAKSKKDEDCGDAESSSFIGITDKVDECLKRFAQIELRDNTVVE